MTATIAFAALVGLTGYASPDFVALAVALAGLVVAWGWPQLLSLPSPRGTTTVLVIGTVLMTGTALLTREAPYLQWMPAALAVAVIGAFLHQLMRRDGRPRLTESVSASITGLAVISAGVALGPRSPEFLNGEHALAATIAETRGAGPRRSVDQGGPVAPLGAVHLHVPRWRRRDGGVARGRSPPALARGAPRPARCGGVARRPARDGGAACDRHATGPARCGRVSSSLLVGVVACVVVRSPLFA